MLALLKAAKGKGQGSKDPSRRHVTRSPKRKRFIKDVLTNLSAASILSLHKEFEEKGGLTLVDFVAAMRKYAGACSDNVVDDRLYALEIIDLYKMIEILRRLIYILRFLFSSGRKEKKQCFKVQSQIAY